MYQYDWQVYEWEECHLCDDGVGLPKAVYTPYPNNMSAECKVYFECYYCIPTEIMFKPLFIRYNNLVRPENKNRNRKIAHGVIREQAIRLEDLVQDLVTKNNGSVIGRYSNNSFETCIDVLVNGSIVRRHPYQLKKL